MTATSPSYWIELMLANGTKLGRNVAVKVLPLSFSIDVDRLHRFQQEACACRRTQPSEDGEGTTFQRGTPKALFDRHIPSFNTPQGQFAVSADSQKFIVANHFAENTSVPITIVLNWTAKTKH